MDALGFDLAVNDEGTESEDDASWIAESGAEAGWGCTRFGVTRWGVTLYYRRLAFDVATFCGG
ncbi:hypothetical protein H1W00_09475 [Aeromicrobium sp. Marseille-Q0843]|uniref:Uncharacterized protein n=1 Tax=Aeromicrobium phoceense TaxID=2754045 RepID=A0A838XIB2_9ACTN|nr:hypothetical protein [Aeromicrobium phoceense]MBA4608701.1 hypothetical protein [Aeromicrobium phoceense]